MRDRRLPPMSRRHAFPGWGPPPFPPDFLFEHRGRRGRGRRNRGDVRAALLALLTERPMHGYEMIQELASRTGGIWRPSPGSVYPTLQLLEDEGLITSLQRDGRKQFTLTDRGAEEAAKVTTPPWQRFADDDTMSTVRDFGTATLGLMNALREVGSSGTDAQRARALEVMADARRKLYAILAEDDAGEPEDEPEDEVPEG
jgi:DNA-binding PadR family transcriptional regulator